MAFHVAAIAVRQHEAELGGEFFDARGDGPPNLIAERIAVVRVDRRQEVVEGSRPLSGSDAHQLFDGLGPSHLAGLNAELPDAGARRPQRKVGSLLVAAELRLNLLALGDID